MGGMRSIPVMLQDFPVTLLAGMLVAVKQLLDLETPVATPDHGSSRLKIKTGFWKMSASLC